MFMKQAYFPAQLLRGWSSKSSGPQEASPLGSLSVSESDGPSREATAAHGAVYQNHLSLLVLNKHICSSRQRHSDSDGSARNHGWVHHGFPFIGGSLVSRLHLNGAAVGVFMELVQLTESQQKNNILVNCNKNKQTFVQGDSHVFPVFITAKV